MVRRTRKSRRPGGGASVSGSVVERFAPSPNGALHLGHAFSAWTAWDAAQAAGGRFLLRLEDLDQARCRPELETAMLEDLAWLGLVWETPVWRQSARMAIYAEALESLRARGLLYPCTCSRKEIEAALDAPQEGAETGPDGPVYPGTCRGKAVDLSKPAALRLDMRKAIATLGGAGVVRKLSFVELDAGPNGETGRVDLDPEALVGAVGDVALARKDIGTSYHLAVVVDDAAQGVTHVTRGRDLFEATPIHRILQALLGRPTPAYRHHRLIRDASRRRLAKRDRDAGVAALRAQGATVAELRARVGLAAD